MKDVKGLLVDYYTGKGEVELDPRFMRENAVFRADVLRDWMDALEALRNSALSELDPELRAAAQLKR